MKKPYMNVFVTDAAVDKASGEVTGTYWTKVGVAFPFKDREGFQLKIKPNIAISGDLVILPPKPDEADASDEADAAE